MLRACVLLSALAVASAWQPGCIGELSFLTPFISGTGTPVDGYQYMDFNVISFGDITSFGGDIEGRALICGNVNFDPAGFSLGMELKTDTPHPEDAQRPFSLIAFGTDFCWRYGTLYPNKDGNPYPSAEEGIFFPTKLMQSDCLPMWLADRQTGMCDQNDLANCRNNLAAACLDIQNYYIGIAADFANPAHINAQTFIEYGQGLVVYANDPAARVITFVVDNSVWNSVTYFRLANMDRTTSNQEVHIIFNNDDGQPTRFGRGAEFPWAKERVVYVFNNPGPEIRVEGGALGNFLAPERTYHQTHGVTNSGYLIFNQIDRLHQANKPDCVPCLVPCSPDCCDFDQQCCSGTECCPQEGECCGAGCPCIDPETCCGGQCCNSSCCGAGNDICCPPDNVCCGDNCCDESHSCCGGDQCCPNDSDTCCGDNCCPAGQSCCGGDICCPAGDECCGDQCCSSAVVAAGGCCTGGSADLCCAPGQECCGNDLCCEIGGGCCSDGSGGERCCPPASEQCCGNDACCQTDQVCCVDGGDGSGRCCEDTQTCCGTAECCNDDQVCCGDTCCAAGEVCCVDSAGNPSCCDHCCNDPAGGDLCCDAEPVGAEPCCGDTCGCADCCPFEVSGERCCPAGQFCCGFECCDDAESCCMVNGVLSCAECSIPEEEDELVGKAQQ